jgi:shikimate dehydrogenase
MNTRTRAIMVDGDTKVYGIIGNPVRHSKSPVMQNAGFAALAENALYLPFQVVDVVDAVAGIRALGIQGVSVTIPHKEKIIDYLDVIDPVARKIGAVNTVKCVETEAGRELHGFNTDWIGANLALQGKSSLPGKQAVILGAGGSARAIGFGLLEAGAKITVCSRTEQRGCALANDLGCSWLPLADLATLSGDILVNATSVGMAPRAEQSLMARHDLHKFKVVMDIVYSPVQTSLLRAAEDAGCLAVSGLEMLLYQGVAQMEIWTGRKAPVEVMRKALFQQVISK